MFALMLTEVLIAEGPPHPQTATPPAAETRQEEIAVLEDVEVTARRGSTGVRPEQEYDAGQIDALGAYDIGDVLRDASRRFGPGEEPVVIINGVRVPNPSIYYGLPPDALERVEVLPAGAAAAFGGPPSRRVINLVTQRQFQSQDGQVVVSGPTDAGFLQGRANGRRSRLNDGDVSNLTLSVAGASALPASERPTYLIDHPGSEGVTLAPESRSVSASAAFNRSLGEWTTSLNINAGKAVSRSTSRLQGALVDLRSDTSNLQIESGLGGTVRDWSVRISVSAQASKGEASGLRPSSTEGRNVTGSFSADRQIAGLPTGPMTTNVSVSAGWNTTAVQAANASDRYSSRTSAMNGQVSIPLLPQADPSKTPFPIPGQASLTLGLGARQSDVGEGGAFDVGLNWQPRDLLRLNAGWRRDVSSPSDLDRFAPVREGPAVVIYDFRTGAAVEVQTVLGGNPNLRAATSDFANLNLSMGPVSPWAVTATLDFSRAQARDGLSTSLSPTEEAEAAFPDRFTRDASGRLIQIDQRPFNTTASDTDRLSANLSMIPASSSSDGRRPSFSVDVGYFRLLRDRVDYGAGLAPVNRLDGDGGGASRQGVSATVRTQRGPWVAEVSGRWAQGYRSRASTGVDGAGDLRIAAFGSADLKVSYSFVGAATSVASATPRRVTGARFELAVLNFFDGRPQARLADGRPAPGYGRDDRDPIGRRVQLTLSKRF